MTKHFLNSKLQRKLGNFIFLFSMYSIAAIIGSTLTFLQIMFVRFQKIQFSSKIVSFSTDFSHASILRLLRAAHRAVLHSLRPHCPLRPLRSLCRPRGSLGRRERHLSADRRHRGVLAPGGVTGGAPQRTLSGAAGGVRIDGAAPHRAGQRP